MNRFLHETQISHPYHTKTRELQWDELQILWLCRVYFVCDKDAWHSLTIWQLNFLIQIKLPFYYIPKGLNTCNIEEYDAGYCISVVDSTHACIALLPCIRKSLYLFVRGCPQISKQGSTINPPTLYKRKYGRHMFPLPLSNGKRRFPVMGFVDW
jgi:hypothetical protein